MSADNKTPYQDRGEVRSAVIAGLRECVVQGYAVESINEAADYVIAALTEAKRQTREGVIPVIALASLADRWAENSRKRALTSAVGAGIDRCVDDLRDLIAAAAKPSGE